MKVLLSTARQMDRESVYQPQDEICVSVQHPRVFAIIPVFNRLPFTLACIEHLRSQTYRPLEIIVVDGGSTDDFPENL